MRTLDRLPPPQHPTATPSLFVTVPCVRGVVDVVTAETLLGLVVECNQAGIAAEIYIDPDPLPHAMERNLLAELFLESKHTHHLSIDDDVGVDPRALVMMLRENRAVIGCMYASRRDHGPIGILKGDDGWTNVRMAVGSPPRRAHRIGTGCMMIRRDVYETLASTVPVYEYDSVRGGNRRYREFFRFDLGPREGKPPWMVTEDFWFCGLAEQAGFELFMMTDLRSLGVHASRVVHNAWPTPTESKEAAE